MTQTSFDPDFDDLPDSLPVFPLSGVLLLPNGRLPLNIFEPRYLAMTQDALGCRHRLIGMIQPTDAVDSAASGQPALYRTGCAGRITAFQETDDGRYLITLTGICRFRVAAELPEERGYRRVTPDWTPFREDLEDWEAAQLDRDRLLTSLKPYFRARGIDANWDLLKSVDEETLVTSLSMICPFDAREKQALLEAATLPDRAQMLLTLVEMAALDGQGGAEASSSAAH